MPDDTVRLISPQGQPTDVPAAEVAIYQRRGFKAESIDESVARTSAESRAEQLSPIEALGQGIASTATLGGSDVLQRALGGENARIYLEQLEQAHPTASAVGQVLGAFVPGAGTLAGAAGRGVAALGEGAGVAGRIGMGAAAGAVEGAIYGAGQGVHELALSDDPLTMERIASGLSSHALFGAGVGAAAGGIGKAAELGLRRAKGAIDDALERRAIAKAKTPEEAIETGDVELLDAKKLNAAEDAELERIRTEQAPQRKAVVDEIDAYRNANRDASQVREGVAGADDRDVREAGAAFIRNDLQLRRMLDDRVGLADNIEKARSALRAQQQSLEEITSWGRRQTEAWQRDVANAPETFRARILNKDIPGEVGPFTPTGLDLAVERTVKEYGQYMWNGAVRDGLKEPAIVSRMSDLETTLQRNLALQSKLDHLALPPTSDRLTKIAEARDALGAPKAPTSSLGAAVSAVAPLAGPLGAAAAAGGHALGKFRQLADAVTARAGKSASAFLGPTIAATKAATPLATKILASLRYGDRKDNEDEPATLPELYKRRTDEVKEQVHIAADGSFQMRPEARQKLADKLAGLGTVDPVTADRLETLGARRIAWLASQIPRQPDLAGVQIGPSSWHPSDLEMRTWARKAAAVEDPHAVLDRVAHGHTTPEDAMAMRAVYPEMMNAFIQQVSLELPTLRHKLPYQRQLALSMFSGVPVDPALDPRILSVLQGHFPSEPGSAGGTQAPPIQPNFGAFGSIKKSLEQPTPAQTRAQGAFR